MIKQMVSDLSARRTESVDSALFNRRKETSIAEYIVDGLKVMESLPYIKFVDHRLITDSSKIDIKLNRRHIKDKKIQNNKSISKIVSIRDTAEEMLQLDFIIDYVGDVRYVRKNLLIPSYIDDYHLLINGKEILPQKQIVDMSTYNQKQSVKLKTTLAPIDIEKVPVKGGFSSTSGKSFKPKTFILNLFTKSINPLYYYVAKFGVTKTINYFSMNNIVDVTDEVYDTNINYYFRINNNLYIEVDKRFFRASEFVSIFTYMLYDIFPARSKSDIVDDVDYWTIKLGSIYTSNTKNQYNKGLNVLISFERALDKITANVLRLDNKNLKSTHSLIRWELQNFNDLRKKDNHDLENKRLRCNEVIAFYFIQSMSQRINNLLNKKKLSVEDIERMFNWNANELIRLFSKSKNTLMKYDPDINNFQMLNALRCSFLGPQGISGGKNISNEFRDIYPSYIGRIDLNAISHGGNSCLTGFLTPRCKIYGQGFFSEKCNDPDNFHRSLNELIKELYDEDIEKEKESIYNVHKKLVIRTRQSILNARKNGPQVVILTTKNKSYINPFTDKVVLTSSTTPLKFVDENGLMINEEGRLILHHETNDPSTDDGRLILNSKLHSDNLILHYDNFLNNK